MEATIIFRDVISDVSLGKNRKHYIMRALKLWCGIFVECVIDPFTFLLLLWLIATK